MGAQQPPFGHDRLPLEFSVAVVDRPLRQTFRIAGRSYDSFKTVVVTVFDGAHKGVGEAAELLYRGVTVERILLSLEAAREALLIGIDRRDLAALMPPGSARNAIDCALWDLESARAGKCVWELAGLSSPRPLVTTVTLSCDTPDAMARAAGVLGQPRALKLKLCGDGDDGDRIAGVRKAQPAARLIADANQSLSLAGMDKLAVTLVRCSIELLEQPLPAGQDEQLAGHAYPVPIFGDESIQAAADIMPAIGRFAGINIKLDKCGGLTEGLLMARLAKALGLRVMVGNMGGSSLAMAPAFLVAQYADYVDLDGPLFLAEDVVPGVTYQDGAIRCPDEVWGCGASPSVRQMA